MNHVLWSVGALLAAYLVGSLSFAVIVSRSMGLEDPRCYGSKNPGATNVLRSGNRTAALLTLLCDALKGYLPVLAVMHFGQRFGLGDNVAAFVGLMAFLGHLWPVFFHFQGGKGVATAAGVLLALNPVLGGSVLMTWMMMAYLTRYSSLAAIFAALCAPLYLLLLGDDARLILAIAIMSVLLIWRHVGNIQKLILGTESKLGRKANTLAASAAHRAKYSAKKGVK